MKKLFLIFGFCIIVASSCAIGAFVYFLNNHCVDFSVLENYSPANSSVVLDDQGKIWTRFQLDRREPINLDQMSSNLIHAFLAAEDWQFYSHQGISLRGIIRSTVVNLYQGKRAQGASTITQQLVRLLFFDARKTFVRKIKEALCALLVERQFSKEQILQTYLNHVYFGCGIYGVQAASQRFWQIDASQLSLEQAAVLAGIVRSPANYCPLLAPANAQKRRNVVLHSMFKFGFISADAYQAARLEAMMISAGESNNIAAHFRETLRITLEDLVGKEKLYSGGLVIATTINQKMQQQAYEVFNKQCTALKHSLNPHIDGALITLEVKTGEIKALIGGYDFAHSKFNRALQAKRQLGSIFKPLIYAAALQNGTNFCQTSLDEPLSMPQANGSLWSPGNYNNRFNGQITLAYALSHSSNIVAVKTLLDVGYKPVIDLARSCGMTGSFYHYPALALGCVDVTLDQVAGMFNVFANGGKYIEPHYIKWIKDKWGKKIYKKTVKHNKVISARIAGQIAKVLTLSLDRIRSAYPGKWLPCQAIAKTGTTNQSRTCWYVGATPEFTTAVYMGIDDNFSMGQNIFPIRTAFPVWFNLNRQIECKTKKFEFDPSLQEVIIDERTGVEIAPGYPGAISIYI